MDATQFMQDLQNLRKPDIAAHEFVKARFIEILKGQHQMTESAATAEYERESLLFRRAINSNEKLRQCDNLMLYSVFLEIAIQNLSTMPGAKAESYIEVRSSKTGQKEERTNRDGTTSFVDVYAQTPGLVITAYGELVQRMRSGELIRMNNPIVVYEGDTFQPRTDSRGLLVIDYAAAIPRKSDNIIACYVSIILPGGLVDFKYLLAEDLDRLKAASIPFSKRKEADSGKYANALYTSNGGQVDPGFFGTKVIKHAMATMPKRRTSQFATYEGDAEALAPTMPEVFSPSYEVRSEDKASFDDYMSVETDEPTEDFIDTEIF